jgi:hypothetical protein
MCPQLPTSTIPVPHYPTCEPSHAPPLDTILHHTVFVNSLTSHDTRGQNSQRRPSLPSPTHHVPRSRRAAPASPRPAPAPWRAPGHALRPAPHAHGAPWHGAATDGLHAAAPGPASPVRCVPKNAPHRIPRGHWHPAAPSSHSDSHARAGPPPSTVCAYTTLCVVAVCAVRGSASCLR